MSCILSILESDQASWPSRDVLIKIGVGLGLEIESLGDLVKLAGQAIHNELFNRIRAAGTLSVIRLRCGMAALAGVRVA